MIAKSSKVVLKWGCVEIRGLDGERKALVYDNYSKLIAATDTIRKVNLDAASPYPQRSL